MSHILVYPTCIKSLQAKDEILRVVGTRRHTLQGGMSQLPRVSAHELHEGILQHGKKKEIILAPEILEHYSDYSREVGDMRTLQ